MIPSQYFFSLSLSPYARYEAAVVVPTGGAAIVDNPKADYLRDARVNTKEWGRVQAT